MLLEFTFVIVHQQDWDLICGWAWTWWNTIIEGNVLGTFLQEVSCIG